MKVGKFYFGVDPEEVWPRIKKLWELQIWNEEGLHHDRTAKLQEELREIFGLSRGVFEAERYPHFKRKERRRVDCDDEFWYTFSIMGITE